MDLSNVMSAEEAFGIATKNRASKWPTRVDGNRLFPDCLPAVRAKQTFSSDSRFFTIGSCFARNIEDYLIRAGITVLSRAYASPEHEDPGARRPNDILVKYTPPSIEAELQLATGRLPPESALVEVEDGQFVDLQLGSLVPVTKERAFERRQQIIDLYRTIASADVVVLTLGLIESWFDSETLSGICGTPSSSLVKKFPGRFKFKVLSFDEARDSVRRSINMILELGAKNIVITTSPVPLGRTFTADDVIVANSYSKSMLRVVASDVKDYFEQVDYYPSYEMVMHSEILPSWDQDQRHVSDARVGLVVAKFLETFLPGASGHASEAREAHVKAMILSGNGQHQEAVELIEFASANLPADDALEADRARVLSSAGRLAEALPIYSKLAEKTKALSPRLSEVDILLRLGRSREAESKLMNLHLDHPASGLVAMMLGNIYDRSGRQSEAQAMVGKAVEIMLTGRREGPFVYRASILLLEKYGEKDTANRISAIARKNYPDQFAA